MEEISIGDEFIAIGIDQKFVITGFKTEVENEGEENEKKTDFLKVRVFRNGGSHKDKMEIKSAIKGFSDKSCYIHKKMLII